MPAYLVGKSHPRAYYSIIVGTDKMKEHSFPLGMVASLVHPIQKPIRMREGECMDHDPLTK